MVCSTTNMRTTPPHSRPVSAPHRLIVARPAIAAGNNRPSRDPAVIVAVDGDQGAVGHQVRHVMGDVGIIVLDHPGQMRAQETSQAPHACRRRAGSANADRRRGRTIRDSADAWPPRTASGPARPSTPSRSGSQLITIAGGECAMGEQTMIADGQAETGDQPNSRRTGPSRLRRWAGRTIARADERTEKGQHIEYDEMPPLHLVKMPAADDR